MGLEDMKNTLWVEKWRPKTLADCTLPDRILAPIKAWVEKGDVPNLLFHGRPGNSKTTLARCIVHDLKAEDLYIDASSENGKSMVQNFVVPFASTVSIVNKDAPKVVILDEADGLSPQAQASFRPVIEGYSKQTRFIFTCNYVQKILPPIQSRCNSFDFNLTKEEKPEVMAKFLRRCLHILKEEGIAEVDKRALGMLIANLTPDYRKVINTLQTYTTTHGKVDEGIITFSSGTGIAEELYPLILKKKYEDCRKLILESSWSPEDIFASLFRYLPDYVDSPAKQAEMTLALAKGSFQSVTTANQDINTLGTIVEMMLAV